MLEWLGLICLPYNLQMFPFATAQFDNEMKTDLKKWPFLWIRWKIDLQFMVVQIHPDLQFFARDNLNFLKSQICDEIMKASAFLIQSHISVHLVFFFFWHGPSDGVPISPTSCTTDHTIPPHYGSWIIQLSSQLALDPICIKSLDWKQHILIR